MESPLWKPLERWSTINWLRYPLFIILQKQILHPKSDLKSEMK